MEYEKASEQRRGEETKYGGPEEINDNNGQTCRIHTNIGIKNVSSMLFHSNFILR